MVEGSRLRAVAELVEATPFDTVVTVLRGQARDHPEDAPDLLAIAAWCAVIRDDLPTATKLARAARAALDDRINDRLDRTLLDALAMVIAALDGAEPFDATLLDELLRGLEAAPPDADALVLEALLEVANWFTFADRYRDAAEILDRRLAGHDPLDELGQLYSLCCLAELDWRRGRWTATTGRLTSMIERAESSGLGTAYANALVARALGASGDGEAAEVHLAAARRTAHERGDDSTRWRVDAVDGFTQLSGGDPAAAARTLAALPSLTSSHGPHLASVRLWDADLAEALALTGRPGDAQPILDRLRLEAKRAPSRFTAGVIARIEALVATNANAAIDWADDAVDAFGAIDAPFEQARSELIRGRALLADGHAADAAHSLRRAGSSFEALGAQAWARLAGSERCGSTPNLDSPGGVATPIVALTPVERNVIDLLLAGRTNRAIASDLHVSVKTVEGHLTRIYRKLGCRSRSEVLARFVRS